MSQYRTGAVDERQNEDQAGGEMTATDGSPRK